MKLMKFYLNICANFLWFSECLENVSSNMLANVSRSCALMQDRCRKINAAPTLILRSLRAGLVEARLQSSRCCCYLNESLSSSFPFEASKLVRHQLKLH